MIDAYAYLVPYIEHNEEIFQDNYTQQKSYKYVCEGKEMKKIILDDEEKDILESYERGEWVPVRIQEGNKSFSRMQKIHCKKTRG